MSLDYMTRPITYYQQTYYTYWMFCSMQCLGCERFF